MRVIRNRGLSGAESAAGDFLAALNTPGVVVLNVIASAGRMGGQQQVDVVVWTPHSCLVAEIKGMREAVSGSVVVSAAEEWTIEGKPLSLYKLSDDVNPLPQVRGAWERVKASLMRSHVEPGFIRTAVILVPLPGEVVTIERDGPASGPDVHVASITEGPHVWREVLGADRKSTCWSAADVRAALQALGVHHERLPSEFELMALGFPEAAEESRKYSPTRRRRRRPRMQTAHIPPSPPIFEPAPIAPQPTPNTAVEPAPAPRVEPAVVAAPTAPRLPPLHTLNGHLGPHLRVIGRDGSRARRWSTFKWSRHGSRIGLRSVGAYGRGQRRRWKKVLGALAVITAVSMAAVAVIVIAIHNLPSWPASKPAVVEPIKFLTPDNTSCAIGVDRGGQFVRCDRAERTFVPPPRPVDCAPDNWGVTYMLRDKGFAFAGCAADYMHLYSDAPHRPRAPGDVVRSGPFGCTIEQSGGVTCRRDSAVGFSVSSRGFILLN